MPKYVVPEVQIPKSISSLYIRQWEAGSSVIWKSWNLRLCSIYSVNFGRNWHMAQKWDRQMDGRAEQPENVMPPATAVAGTGA